MQHRKSIAVLAAILVALGAFSTSSASVLFVEEADDPGIGGDEAGAVTYAVDVTYEVPLDPGWNLISLGGNSAGEDINVVLSGIIADVVKVIGFETPAINPNTALNGDPLIGGKYYDPALLWEISTLHKTDPRLGYWIYMNAAAPLSVPPPLKLVSAPVLDLVDGGLHPVYDFMGIYGNLSIEDEPAPVGTVVEVFDGEGNLAGSAEVRYPGLYGFLPIYRDNLSSPVDEGADTGEWLTIQVDGRFTGHQVQWSEFGDAVNIDVAVRPLPTQFALQSNYPNPFNPSTTVPYQLSGQEDVVLSVWNAVGQQVRTLVSASQVPGHYTVTWDGRDDVGRSLADGVYFVRLQAGDYMATQKMVLLK